MGNNRMDGRKNKFFLRMCIFCCTFVAILRRYANLADEMWFGKVFVRTKLEIKETKIMKKEVSTKKLLETIIEGIQNRKGQRIVTVDLRKLPVAPAEYFVIAEGGSNTQVAAIADEVDSFVRTVTHVHPLFVDGRDNAEWIVLDYGNIFVHIMQREPRAYYDIEHLWADGKITEIPEV